MYASGKNGHLFQVLQVLRVPLSSVLPTLLLGQWFQILSLSISDPTVMPKVWPHSWARHVSLSLLCCTFSLKCHLLTSGTDHMSDITYKRKSMETQITDSLGLLLHSYYLGGTPRKGCVVSAVFRLIKQFLKLQIFHR